MMNDIIREMHESYQKECEEAVKSLVLVTGFKEEDLINLRPEDLPEAVKEMRAKGWTILQFSEPTKPLERFFILTKDDEYVAAVRVNLNFELNTIQRDIIPHDSEYDEIVRKIVRGLRH